jgi:methionine aminopeptidase
MVELKTRREIASMAEAGAVVAEALRAVVAYAKPGMTTVDLDRVMHEDPDVPNKGRPGKGMKLRPGLVIAIEPMVIGDGTDEYRHDPDGWTLRTLSGARAAHSEHTVAVTADGARILTS